MTESQAPRLRVKELRDRLGWTQMKLAAEASMHPAEISRIEHGHRELKVSTLLKLAGALGVGVGDLFPAEPPPPKPPNPRTKPEVVAGKLIEMTDSAHMGGFARGWAGDDRAALDRLLALRAALQPHLERYKDGSDRQPGAVWAPLMVRGAFYLLAAELAERGEVKPEEAKKLSEAA